MNTKENYGEVTEGLFRVDTIKDGEIIDTYEQKNRIMVTARDAMARNMSGKYNTTSPINRFVLGSMGHDETILDPSTFTKERVNLFAEAHQETKNVTDLGFTFDGVDTITNVSGSTSVLAHNKFYRIIMTDGKHKEFKKIENAELADSATYVINSNGYEPLQAPISFVDVVRDLGLIFDGVSLLTNPNIEPVVLKNNVVYTLVMTDGSSKEFTKALDFSIPKEGGLYDIQLNAGEPIKDVQMGNTFVIDFDSTDGSLMTVPRFHETIILASDGDTKSYKIEGIQSYAGLPVAPISSGVNINVIAEANKVTYKITIPQTQGNADGGGVVAYTEAALYCDSDIFSMKTFPARTKDNSLEYVVTWVITF